LTFQYPCSPLAKGGEGWGEGGFEACAFTNFGCAVGTRQAHDALISAVGFRCAILSRLGGLSERDPTRRVALLHLQRVQVRQQ
jgi:hypothetical protein